MADSETGPPAPEGLLSELYEELRALAAHHLRGERQDHTLQPTALVHEAYLRMSGRSSLAISGRTHFMAIASIAMRRVLVDLADVYGEEQVHVGYDALMRVLERQKTSADPTLFEIPLEDIAMEVVNQMAIITVV